MHVFLSLIHIFSENERTARAVVSAFLVQLDPTVEELADIRTAVSEAVTNAIVHGYRQCSGDVELHIKLLEDREIYLRIKDHGCGITDVAQAMQPLFTTAPEEERAGLGFAVKMCIRDRTCTCVMPRMAAVLLWVSSRK